MPTPTTPGRRLAATYTPDEATPAVLIGAAGAAIAAGAATFLLLRRRKTTTTWE